MPRRYGDNRFVTLRSPLAPENLLALVERIKEQRRLPQADASLRKMKALAKTLEIHAPDRVVAFLAKVVQLDIAKLQSARREQASAIADGLARRLEWLERILGGDAPRNFGAPPRYKYAEMESAKERAGEVMTAEQDSSSRTAHGQDQVLELELGCLVAYFQLTAPKRQMEGPMELIQALPMVAIALSTVAPIWRASRSGAELVSMRELQPRLFARDESGVHVAHLEGLGIRRRDLHHAITVLRDARMSFGGGRK